MAKFVYGEADRGFIALEAEPGEEIPVEMVTAWATLQLATALDQISDNLRDIDLSISGLGSD